MAYIYFSSSDLGSPIELDAEEEYVALPLGLKSSKHEGKEDATKTTNEEREVNYRSRLDNLSTPKEKDIAK